MRNRGTYLRACPVSRTKRASVAFISSAACEMHVCVKFAVWCVISGLLELKVEFWEMFFDKSRGLMNIIELDKRPPVAYFALEGLFLFFKKKKKKFNDSLMTNLLKTISSHRLTENRQQQSWRVSFLEAVTRHQHKASRD